VARESPNDNILMHAAALGKVVIATMVGARLFGVLFIGAGATAAVVLVAITAGLFRRHGRENLYMESDGFRLLAARGAA
jgi:NADH:ubiquinone oxidoreductase subunit K